MNPSDKIAKETDKQIAKELVQNGFVIHRINKDKEEQVKISEKGLVALRLLKKLQKLNQEKFKKE